MPNLQNLINEIREVYSKHGWQLRRLLLTPETRSQIESTTVPEGVRWDEASFDAMWFTRASHGGREAWELRLVAEQPFALFETFEPDETEEQREDVRREMESRMRSRLNDER